MLPSIRSEFMLDPDIHYLNHGSFGACPRMVFEDFQNWQRILEANPLDYFTRQLKGLFHGEASGPLEDARQALGEFVNADADGLIFTPNVTIALNAIASSLQLEPGDEVLTTDHEYGTILATWARKCDQEQARLTQVSIPLPVNSHQAFIDDFWQQVTSRTKVILLSHITSATALILPVKEICRRARKAGITTIIDGAHAVGQIPLDINDMAADFYTSNCHKWLLTPKGTAFLHVHESQRTRFEPMIISWAEINQPSFALRHEMWGTRDMAGFLSIPTALAFREKHDWRSRQAEAHEVIMKYRDIFSRPLEEELICDQTWIAQMASIRLPATLNMSSLWKFLWEEYSIEAMLTQWQDTKLLRLSFNAYNTPEELDLLLQALQDYSGRLQNKGPR